MPVAPAGSRTIADGAASSGQAFLTSATAAFTLDDVQSVVWCPAFPVGTQIAGFIDSHTVTLSSPAELTAIGLAVIVGASVALNTLRPNA